MKIPRIGVIGVGRMGTNHVRVLTGLSGKCKLSALYDEDSARAEAVGAVYGVTVANTLNELCNLVDAVVVAVSAVHHRTVTSQCLNLGMHVLVEKPLACSEEDAIHMLDLAQEQGLILTVGHVERFNPAIIQLQRMVSTVPILAADFRRLGPHPSTEPDVDVVLDLMVHDLDLARRLLPGVIDQFQAISVIDPKSGFAEHAVAQFRVNGRQVVCLTASRMAEQKIRQLHLIVEGAVIEADLISRKLCACRGTVLALPPLGTAEYCQESVFEQVFVPNKESLVGELEHFLALISGQAQSTISATDELEIIQLAAAVRNSVYADQSMPKKT